MPFIIGFTYYNKYHQNILPVIRKIQIKYLFSILCFYRKFKYFCDFTLSYLKNIN